jgi:DNA-binding SARP family transcriptional activator
MLELRLLGEHRVAVDGSVVDLGRSMRLLGLLGYLAVHAGAPQLRQHLAGVFWPDSTDAQARTNLRRELHHLRSLLPRADEVLLVDDTAVTWRDDGPCHADVIEFAHAARAAERAEDEDDVVAAAERAVGAYRGPLLPGLYDDWVLEERERLHRGCVMLLDRLVRILADREEVEAALGHARRRVELEPLEEVGHATLMRLQAHAGDRAAALRTFHACASMLDRELGVAPSDTTLAVYEELVARRPASAAGRQSLRRVAPLVGRDEELRWLVSRWQDPGPLPRVAVVAGEAGVGKSRIVAELADALEREGVRIARARCYAARGGLALGPVASWLRAPAVSAEAAELDPVWRAEVGRLVPELGADGEQGRPTPLADSWQRHRFFEGLARAVTGQGRATLLVLDDLQWCDGDTLAWLEVLLHLQDEAPILVLATLRSEELSDHPELVEWRRRLQALDRLDELELGPLAEQEAAELVAALTGTVLDDQARRHLAASTGGFPLLVVESLREDGAGAPRIDAVLSGRFARLSSGAEELVGLAAAAGRDVTLDLLAAAGVGDEVLLGAIDELWHRRLLREHGAHGYDFAHDLLREAAYERLTPPHRRLLHRRLADALERLHAAEPATVAAQLAHHHARGGQAEQAVHFHGLAAEGATEVFAHEEAVAHDEAALALLAELPAGAERDRRELALREHLLPSLVALQSYAAPRLGATLRRMGELAERLGDEASAIRAQAARSAYLFVRGRIHESEQVSRPLMAHAADHPDQIGQLSVSRGWALTSLGQLAEALEHFALLEEHTDVTEVSPLGFPVRVMGLGWRSHALALVGRSGEAVASATAAIELADELEHPFSRAIACGYAALAHRLLGDRERTAELAGEVREHCERYDFAYYREWGCILQGWASGGPEGTAAVRAGLERLMAQEAGTRRPFWLALLAEVLAAHGDATQARHVLAQARAWADETGDRWWLAELWRLDAHLAPEAEAQPLLDRALETAAVQGATALELRAAIDRARRPGPVGAAEAVARLREVRARAPDPASDDAAAADSLLAPTC